MNFEEPQDYESYPRFAAMYENNSTKFSDGVVILRQLTPESKTQGLNSKWEVIWETTEDLELHLSWSWNWAACSIKYAMSRCIESNRSQK